MDKRTLILGSGALAAAMIPLALKSEAAETPDWRDELLDVVNKNNAFQIYYKSEDDISKSLYIFGPRIDEKRFTVNHVVLGWKKEEDDTWTSERYIDEETKFDTLKEAYLYAKELKQKHYG